MKITFDPVHIVVALAEIDIEGVAGAVIVNKVLLELTGLVMAQVAFERIVHQTLSLLFNEAFE